MAPPDLEPLRYLIAEIVNARRPAGEALPSHEEITTEFVVSRMVAREALGGLEKRGLAQVADGGRAIVASPSEWNVFDPDVFAALLGSARAQDTLAQYLECRAVLEVGCAGLAAHRASEQEIEALDDAYATMLETARSARHDSEGEPRYQEADIAFHRAVAAASGNFALGRMTAVIHRVLGIAIRPLARPEFRLERGLSEHARIRDAIAVHDPAEARAAMQAHLATIAEYLRAYGPRPPNGARLAPAPEH